MVHLKDSLACLCFQVETVGDKYMAVSGLPDHCEDHAKCMARVALDMMDMAKNVKMGSNPVVSVEYNKFRIYALICHSVILVYNELTQVKLAKFRRNCI